MCFSKKSQREQKTVLVFSLCPLCLCGEFFYNYALFLILSLLDENNLYLSVSSRPQRKIFYLKKDKLCT